MPGLLDIAPPEFVKRRVTIRGGDLELRALRNKEWAMLMHRFPELRQQLRQIRLDPDSAPDADELVTLEITAAVIAASLDKIDDAETEREVYRRLTDAEQQQCFGIIMALTNPPADPLAEGPATAGQAGNGATGAPRPSSN